MPSKLIRCIALAAVLFSMIAPALHAQDANPNQKLKEKYAKSPLIRDSVDYIAAQIIVAAKPLPIPHWAKVLEWPEDPLSQHVLTLCNGVVYDARVPTERADKQPTSIPLGIQFSPWDTPDQSLGHCALNMERWSEGYGDRIKVVIVDSEFDTVRRVSADASDEAKAAARKHNESLMRRHEIVNTIIRHYLPRARILYFAHGHIRTGNAGGFAIDPSPYFTRPLEGVPGSTTLWAPWEPQLMRNAVAATVEHWHGDDVGIVAWVALGWGQVRTSQGIVRMTYDSNLYYSFAEPQYLLHHTDVTDAKIWPHPIGRTDDAYPYWLRHFAAYVAGRHGWSDQLLRLEEAEKAPASTPKDGTTDDGSPVSEKKKVTTNVIGQDSHNG